MCLDIDALHDLAHAQGVVYIIRNEDNADKLLTSLKGIPAVFASQLRKELKNNNRAMLQTTAR